MARIIMLLCWVYYAALIYTGFNPSHDYIGALENATVLYLIIHVPLNLFFGFMATFILFLSKPLKEEFMKDVEGQSSKKVEKLKKEFLKLNSKKMKALLGFNRLISMLTTVAVFVLLEQMFLGCIMLMGTFSAVIVMGFIKEIYEEVLDA